jgi:hypothetical protein
VTLAGIRLQPGAGVIISWELDCPLKGEDRTTTQIIIIQTTL